MEVKDLGYDPAELFSKIQESVLEFAHSYITTVNEYMGIDTQTYHTEDPVEAKELSDKIAEYIETDDFYTEWITIQLETLYKIKYEVDKAIDVVTLKV